MCHGLMFKGKVFHPVIVLEKKLYWYDVVDDSEVDGRTWLLSLMASSMMG